MAWNFSQSMRLENQECRSRARLCSVDRKSVSNFIRDMGGSKREINSLEDNPSKYSRVRPKGLTPEERSYISHLSFISASICADVIEHYAFHSRYKTKEALFAYQKFAKLGISTWIQQMTDWHGNAVPKNGIVTDFNTIDTLLNKKLDGTSYRVYLVLQKALRLRMKLTADEIMQRADISRSTYASAVTKLDELGLLPDWCKIQRKAHPEREVRDRLQAQLGGKVEAYTRWGLIDLLTETQLIEVKVSSHWKDAIGHLIAKSRKYPNHQKRLHLFGYEEPCLEHIEDVCRDCQIQVTFEKVEKPEKTGAIQ